jgi:aryl-alcohol dehydrogenase-like predicted oxidoreductase
VNKRPYGKTGKMVSEIGFGAWQLGNYKDWSGMTDEDAIKLVHSAIDRGVNFFDTAPNYGLGKSEELLGKALKGKREQVIINTKFGHDSKGITNFDPKKLRQSVEDSLINLKTDYLDSVILHNPPYEVLNGNSPHYEIFERLVESGKIATYGASVDSSREMLEVINTTNSGVLEVLFNIFHQGTSEAFEAAKSKGIGIIAKVPLDSGWLSGKYNSKSNFEDIRSRWSIDTIKRRTELLDRITFISNDEISMTQAALRFILSYSEISTVIPGTKNLKQLEENISASLENMDRETVKKLNNVWEEEIKFNSLPW